MTWFFVTIISYALFAVAAVGDRYLLSGPIPDHKLYTFYIGVLGMAVFLFTPFLGISFIGFEPFIVALFAGIAFGGGLFFFFYGLERFEASRVVPAIGGLLPLVTLIFSVLFFRETRAFGVSEIGAFILLVSGSVLITRDKKGENSKISFSVALTASFLFGLSFVLTKYVFLIAPFWSAFAWTRAGVFLVAATLFAFSGGLRWALFHPPHSSSPSRARTNLLFLGNQAVGAGAGLLQNAAIFLAPPLYLSFINALQGAQYVFVLVFTAFLSFKFPAVLREEFAKRVLLRKIFATLIIVLGILILAFTTE